jgi:solute carrier family 25 (mitochondrial citrate transporter), member 1
MKTRQQLGITLVRQGSIFTLGRTFYKGCSALVIGNSSKALLRFSVYNWATKFMADAQGQVQAPQVVVAGMMTGLSEAILVVPFESK